MTDCDLVILNCLFDHLFVDRISSHLCCFLGDSSCQPAQMPDKFDLFSVSLSTQQAVHRVHPECPSGSPGETETRLSD